MSISVLIADDHKLVREAWNAVIRYDRDFTVVADCGSGKEAVELAMILKPDIILMDINLPHLNGIEATQQIHKMIPSSKVIAVSAHNHPSYVRKMIKAGAAGYVTKTSSKDELFVAMRNAIENKRYLCDETKNLLAEQAFNGDQTPGVACLTKREQEIILLIKQGLTSKEIAGHFGLSVKTVEVHRYNILHKLNLRNSAALVNYINHHVIN